MDGARVVLSLPPGPLRAVGVRVHMAIVVSFLVLQAFFASVPVVPLHPCSPPLPAAQGQRCQRAWGWQYRVMEKLLLGERNAGPAVGLLGELVLGVRAQMVIYRGFWVGQRVHHSK